MSTNKNLLRTFRLVATIEGVSLIILLCFSVLKRTTEYAWAPLGVTYVGMAHGLLVFVFCYLLFACWQKYKWSLSKVVLFFVASLIPFAPFIVDRRLKKEIEADR